MFKGGCSSELPAHITSVQVKSIVSHNKIFVLIMIFTTLSFLRLTHGLFFIWRGNVSWTLWKSCFSIYKSIYILKIYFWQNKSYKKRTLFSFASFFFFTFNLRFLYELKAQGSCLWNCVGFSIVDSVLFLLNFIFLFNKQKYGLLDFKTS